MIKIMGFLIGLALAVAGMVYYLDPQPPSQPTTSPVVMPIPPEAEQTAGQEAPLDEKLNEISTTDVHAISTPTPLAATATPIPADQPLEEAPPIAIATLPADAPPESDIADAPSAEPLNQPSVEADRYWHVFWKPFSTRLSAQGFSSHITHVTGVPITVIEKAAGQFVVAFSYQDSVDLDDKIAQIEQRAKIKLPAQRSDHD